MRVQSLQLSQYRNLAQVSLCFRNDLHIFIGANAQGKTNLLESLYLLSFGKSHRTRSHRELIRFGHPYATIEAKIHKETTSDRIRVVLSPQGKKIKKNNLEQKKLSQYIGTLPTVLFAPEDLALIKGSPRVRRRFVDMELGQVSPSYLHHLMRYQKLVQQRNRYLKEPHPQSAFLEVLNEQLVQLALPIWKKRRSFLHSLRRWAREIHHSITDHHEELTIQYVYSLPELEQTENEQEWSQMVKEALQRVQPQEQKRRMTLLGPHRDDIRLFIGDLDVGAFGSQGQQRTAALSLKLAEIELIHQETNTYPILLLDDVLSELDDTRKTHLLSAIRGRVQTFVTTTSLDGIDPSLVSQADLYHVENGTVKQ